jgi:hypothetical protein
MSKQSEREAKYLFGTDRYVRGGEARTRYLRKDFLLQPPGGWAAPKAFGCKVDADPRLELMIREASKYLPNGWQVSTGERIGDSTLSGELTGVQGKDASGSILRSVAGKTSNHGGGRAIDIHLITNEGKVLGNIRNVRTFRAYELFAQCVAKCIITNIVKDDNGETVDWSDLRYIEGGRERSKLGHRREFDENGVENTDPRNEEGTSIKDTVQVDPPDTDTNIGVRWGGYFGNENAKTYRVGEQPTLESLKKTDGPGYHGITLVEWGKDDKPEFTGRFQAVYELDGKPFSPDFATNVVLDSMHFDFSGAGDTAGRTSGYWSRGLSEHVKRVFTRPDGKPPDCRPVKNWSEFNLPQSADESRDRFQEGLGIPLPDGYVVAKPPPAAPAVVINSCVAPKPKVEIDSTALMSPQDGRDVTEYPPIPVTQPGTVAIPAKASRTQAAWNATVNTANTVIDYITK